MSEHATTAFMVRDENLIPIDDDAFESLKAAAGKAGAK
jgi:hypothetical protein